MNAAASARGERVAIVGAGLLGLTLALRLAAAGRRVTVFDGADVAGGLAAPWTLIDESGADGRAGAPLTWDRHYHVTLFSDRALRAVLDELGLAAEMEWVVTQTGCFAGGRLHPASTARDFLRLPFLSLIDKLRIALTMARGARVRDWTPLAATPVEEWLVRWSGRRAFDRFWRPLLRAKLGANAADTSAVFIGATLARLYAARRAKQKRELFGFVPGGYARIVERFVAVLAARGVAVRLRTPVHAVARAAGADAAAGRLAVTVAAADGSPRRELFERVVVTPAAPLAARLCPDLSEAERAQLLRVRYQGIVCASLVLARPLAGYYLTNITDDGLPFTGVVEMSALVDPRRNFGGRTLVYLPRYVASDDPFLRADDATVAAEFLPGLFRMFPQVTRADVRALRVSRVPLVCPIPLHADPQPPLPFATSVAGLHMVTSAHLGAATLNVNETVQLAERAAAALLAADATEASR